MRRALFLVALALLGAATAFAQEPTTYGFEPVGRLGGEAFAIAVEGRYAYVTDVNGALRVVDVGDPTRPTEVAVVAAPPGQGSYGVAARQGFVYQVTGGSPGQPAVLRTVDARDPVQPRETSVVAMRGYAFGAWPPRIVMAGSHAFVADGQSWLRIYDLADPARPVEVAAHVVEANADLAVEGGRAYVSSNLRGTEGSALRIVDVADPRRPFDLGSLPQSNPRGVAPWESTAHVVGGTTLRAISVCDPGAPRQVGEVAWSSNGFAARAVAADGVVYASDAGAPASLLAIDVRDPSRPRQVGAYGAGLIGDVAVSGGLIYVAATTDGLRIVRFTGVLPTPAPLPSAGAFRLLAPSVPRRC
jgi:hypothetical protein